MSADSTLATNLQLVAAAGAVLAPLAGPQAALASQVMAQGLAFWADYAAKQAAGTLTLLDVEEAAMKTGTDLAQLIAHRKVQAAAESATGGA